MSERWHIFARSLRQIGLGLFAKANVKITEEGKGDVRILGLMLLARTLSNLKSALTLIDAKQIVEARVCARCCYENQYWILALLKDGEKFKEDWTADEMKRKRMHAQEIHKGDELDEGRKTALGAWIEANKGLKNVENLMPKRVAKRAESESYVFYQHLSWDVHPSIQTLNRYFMEADGDGAPGIDIEPDVKRDEVIETLNLLCLPVIVIFHVVAELLGHDPVPEEVGVLAMEYQKLTQETGSFLNRAN